MSSDDERQFGTLVAGLLDRLQKGDMQAADQLWDVGGTLPEDKRKQLEERVHEILDKFDL